MGYQNIPAKTTPLWSGWTPLVTVLPLNMKGCCTGILPSDSNNIMLSRYCVIHLWFMLMFNGT